MKKNKPQNENILIILECIRLKTIEINKIEPNLNSDDIINYLMEVKWQKKVLFHQIMIDIISIKTKDIINFLHFQIIIQKDKNLSDFENLF